MLVAALLLVIEVAALAQGFPLALLIEFDVIELLIGLEGLAGGRLDAALFLHCRLACSQLVFHGHHAGAVAIPLLLLPARPTNTKLLEQPGAQLLELVFGALVNNDSIRPAADDLFNGEFPGAQHAFTQQGHSQGADHQGGQLAGFDVEAEAQHPAQLVARFGDHLAVDHLAVTVRVEALRQRIGGIHQDHIAHLADPVEGHPARQAWQEAGQRVVAQAQRHHFAPVDIHHHLAHHAQPAAGVAGDHLGAHQLGAQPEAITWGGSRCPGIRGRGDGGGQ